MTECLDVRAGLFFGMLAIGTVSSAGVLVMGVASRASAMLERPFMEAPSAATPAPAPAETTPPPTIAARASTTPSAATQAAQGDTSSTQATAPASAGTPAPPAPVGDTVPVLGAALASVATLVDGPEKGAALLDLMNTQRIQAGLPALIRDDALTAVGRARAESLIANGYFDHYSPSGESAFSELASRGIRYRLAGENLARNTYPDGRTAGAALDALMASPGHRANILEPRFTHAGVSAVRSGRVWLYVTVFTD